jgi:hypothetical protein
MGGYLSINALLHSAPPQRFHQTHSSVVITYAKSLDKIIRTYGTDLKSIVPRTSVIFILFLAITSLRSISRGFEINSLSET